MRQAPPRDFPAAHSMDTVWYAVDADGVVAAFDTNEDGALPTAAAHSGGPGDPNFDDALVAEAMEAGKLVVYGRDHGDEPGAYTRDSVPATPLRDRDLPVEAAAALSGLRLPLRFAETEKLHLADHMKDQDAVYWGEDWTLRGFGEAAPLAGSGVSPSPSPGGRGGPLWPLLAAFVLVLIAIILGLVF